MMPKASPEISVIMLTYNRQQYVKEAIESILQQSFTDFEYIIVDNGSTDQSGAICDACAETDSRIKVLHREKGNIGAGRNTGVQNASGRYIAFLDDDDRAHPEMLEFLWKLAETHQADIAVCGSEREENGVLTPKYVYRDRLVLNAAQSVKELLRRKYYNVSTPTKLFRRELFSEDLFPEVGRYDDISATYRLFAQANRVAAEGKPLYVFRRHLKNQSNFTTNDALISPEQLEEYLRAFRERTRYLTSRFPEIADYVRYCEWSYMISMCHKISVNHLEACLELLEHMKAVLRDNLEEFYLSSYIQAFEKEWIHEMIVLDKKEGY